MHLQNLSVIVILTKKSVYSGDTMMVGNMMKVDAVIAARAEESACVFLYAVEAKNGGFIERFPVYSEH